MKKARGIITIALAIGLCSLQLFAQSPDEKAEAARKDIKAAQRELREAKIDSAADYTKFKNEAELKLKENRASISMLKAKKYQNAKTMQATYDNSIKQLETRNLELEKKIKGSATTSTVKWTSFKREFNHDMEELGKSIKDISTKYPK